MRLSLGFCLICVLLFCAVIQVSSSPGRKSGGGGRKSSSGGFFGSSSSGKKNKKLRTLGKVAAVGAGAYGAYQLGKVAGRFSGYSHHGGYGYQDWNRWREQDGMLCRRDDDCRWIDPSMECEDYELDFSINRGWFGGDYLSVVGECECQGWNSWDNWEFRCTTSILSMIGTVVGVLALLSCCGCCIAAYCFFKRR